MINLKRFYHIESNVFTPEECELIQSQSESQPSQQNVSLGFRETQLFWLDQSITETKWIFERLLPLSDEVRKKNWRTFKLQGIKPLQYTIYHAPYGKYNWHTDTADVNARDDMAHRILSFSVQLTDPTKCYKGGEFELIEELKDNFRCVHVGDSINMDKRVIVDPFPQGAVVFFPSIVIHRVAPVLEGTRKSLVGWIEGRFI